MKAKALDQKALAGEVLKLRNAIASDWAELATKGLTHEQRKAIQVRLQANLRTLSQLKFDPNVRKIGTDSVKNVLGL